MSVKDCPKKNSEVGEEVPRRSLHEKFPNRWASRKICKLAKEVHRRSLREKFPNRWPSKIARRKIRKLAKKSIEDHSAKNFPTDVRQRLPEEKLGSWRRSPSKIAPRKVSQPMSVKRLPEEKYYGTSNCEFNLVVELSTNISIHILLQQRHS